ncbi:MAG: hypothetical protein GXX08_03660 [Firmicutes bacterium]|nr:hypothetical protein [Bacillota bacterium]
MPSAIGVMFVLYIVVSIISGIVSSVMKQSQTTSRRRRPVYAPDEQVRRLAEADVRKPEEQLSPTAGEGHSDWIAVEEQVGPAEGEGDPGWTVVEKRLSSTLTDDFSGSIELDDYSDSAVAVRPRQTKAVKGSRSAGERDGRPESLTGAPAFPARFLPRDREQLRAMIVAVEVLGEPKGLKM